MEGIIEVLEDFEHPVQSCLEVRVRLMSILRTLDHILQNEFRRPHLIIRWQFDL